MKYSKPLRELVGRLAGRVRVTGELDGRVSGVTLDSRTVQPGDLFVALSGGSVDGHRFIPMAVARGAAAVVGSQALEDFGALAVPYLQVEDGRWALAELSAALYDDPARRLTVIGVTGTDGKTTTSTILHRMMLAAGLRAGLVSTVSAVIGEQELDTGFHVTTPEAPDVQRYLAQMVEAGLTHVVLEATSHGLAQQRIGACEFDVAVVTNVTHEHLDYHGSYEAYREAKGRLFRLLGETQTKLQGNPRLAVLNREDSSFDYLASVSSGRVVCYAVRAMDADVRVEELEFSPRGMRMVVCGPGFRQALRSNLVGEFNVSNLLAAFSAAVLGLGMDSQAAADGAAALMGVPGRMERIDLGQAFTAVVDFAHTPNALKRALEALRPLTNGRLIAVFGSAGLRDRAKRRMMADVSIRLADYTILTAEDPRSESLGAILEEMAAAAQAAGGVEGKNFWRVGDRREAIRRAVQMAGPGDLVVACGKGHEQSLCFGSTEYAWDDRVAMRSALAELLKVDGPEMPYLPPQEPLGK